MGLTVYEICHIVVLKILSVSWHGNISQKKLLSIKWEEEKHLTWDASDDTAKMDEDAKIIYVNGARVKFHAHSNHPKVVIQPYILKMKKSWVSF